MLSPMQSRSPKTNSAVGVQNANNPPFCYSSVTDPYHGIERKYRLTRGILEVIVEQGYTGPISILTKSPLVLQDVELLKQINADVGLTITTTDDQLSRFLEVKAPLASRRLETVSQVNSRGHPYLRIYWTVAASFPHPA